MPLAKHEVKSTPKFRNKQHYPTGLWFPESGSVGWAVFNPSRTPFSDFHTNRHRERVSVHHRNRADLPTRHRHHHRLAAGALTLRRLVSRPNLAAMAAQRDGKAGSFPIQILFAARQKTTSSRLPPGAGDAHCFLARDRLIPDAPDFSVPAFRALPPDRGANRERHDDNPMPKAKTERLIVREIDSETLVYDRSRHAASCLNEFAARVWRECDGETSVAEIAAALGEDERAVWLALHQLTKAQLLTEAIALPPDMSAAKSRREIGARLGLGAAAFVASIVAPMPAQAATAVER